MLALQLQGEVEQFDKELRPGLGALSADYEFAVGVERPARRNRLALLRRDHDRARQLGEHLAALLVGRGLLVLDGGPLGMAGHGISLRVARGTAGAGARRPSAPDGTRLR